MSDASVCAGADLGLLCGDQKALHTNRTGGGDGMYQRCAAGERDADGSGSESKEGFGHCGEQTRV